jgi:virginiamycin B lyase
MLLDASPAPALGVNQYPVSPSPSSPGDITVGPDGNLWFTDAQNNAIGRIIPGAGTVTEYGIATPNSGVASIALGSDGNLWFTESGADKIGTINPTSPSTPVEYQVPTAGSAPDGIAAGADGDLWFTESHAGQIGQFAPSSPTVITETPIPGCSTACTPGDITAGPDKNLWFTEFADKIGRIRPATHKIVQFPAGPKFGRPESIIAGSNGMLWFVELAPESSVDIVQAMTTSGALAQSATFTYTDGCCADITSGPDKDIWVAEEGGNNDVVQFDTNAAFVSATPIPSSSSVPGAMTPGPDGNIWFTDDSLGTDGVTGNIDEVKLPNLNLINILYLPNRFFVPNEVNLPQQGDTANWLGLHPKINSITDASGMGLFGSQDSPSAIDSTYSFAFTSAGTYTYRGGAGGSGKVAVPITVQLQPGTTDTAQVTWASASPPGGFAFDVEVKTPGSHSFVSWQAGATATSGTLGPLSGPYTGPGTYHFRSRIRNTGSGAASGYSAPGSITLT